MLEYSLFSSSRVNNWTCWEAALLLNRCIQCWKFKRRTVLTMNISSGLSERKWAQREFAVKYADIPLWTLRWIQMFYTFQIVISMNSIIRIRGLYIFICNSRLLDPYSNDICIKYKHFGYFRKYAVPSNNGFVTAFAIDWLFFYRKSIPTQRMFV